MDDELSKLKDEVLVRDKAISELKEKTKAYIQKVQQDHADALQREKELTKQAQDKVDAAKQFFNKMKDEEAHLKAEIERLVLISNESSDKYTKISEAYEKVTKDNESLKLKNIFLSSENESLSNQLTESTIQRNKRDSLNIVQNVVSNNQNVVNEELSKWNGVLSTENVQETTANSCENQGNDMIASASELQERLRSVTAALHILQIQFTETSEANLSLQSEITALKSEPNPSSASPARTPEAATSQLQQQLKSQMARNDELQREVRLLRQAQESRSQEALEREKELRAEILQYREQLSAIEVEHSTSPTTSVQSRVSSLEEEKRALLDAMRKQTEELRQLEASYVQYRHDHETASWGLRKEVETQRAKIQRLESDCKQLSSRCEASEGQLQDKVRLNEELTVLLRSKEEMLVSLQDALDTKEKTHKQILSQANITSKQRIAQLTTDLDLAKEKVVALEKEIGDTKVHVTATGNTNSALQAQNDVLKNEVDRLTAQLHHALADIQDRKKKVRAYVDQLTAEKKALEDCFTEKSNELARLQQEDLSQKQKISSLEHKVNSLKDDIEIAKECHQKELKQQEVWLRNELEEKEIERERLQLLIEEFSKTSGDEVREARARVEAANKEAEEHKTKRIAARNEMIAMSEALEQTKKDLEALQTFLRYTLTPLLYEQVSSVETILMSVEGASDRLSSKKTLQMQTKARVFLENQFRRKRDNLNDPNGTSLDISTRDMDSGLREDSSLDSTISPNSTNKFIRKEVSDTIQSAEHLKNEMDRLKAGLVLLGLSVDSSGHSRRGYSAVSSMDNSDHGSLSSHGLTTLKPSENSITLSSSLNK